MSGWNLGVYAAGAILVIGPVIVFTIYLREMIRRIREHDLGSKPSPEEEGSRGKER
ncbi:MAG: hypothetical protein GX044_06105 [Firmicutes bacterium]|nr:hypothetical protein [Bacillota bacterium]